MYKFIYDCIVPMAICGHSGPCFAEPVINIGIVPMAICGHSGHKRNW